MMKQSDDEISHWMIYRRKNPIALESTGIFPFTLVGITEQKKTHGGGSYHRQSFQIPVFHIHEHMKIQYFPVGAQTSSL